jgi:hypothetical protein
MAMQLSLQLFGQLDMINYANNMAEVDTHMKKLGDRLIATGIPEKIRLGTMYADWKENIPPNILWADIAPTEKIDIIISDYIN